MATSEKLKIIDTQIDKLKKRKEKLEEKRKNQICLILNRCGAQKMPDEILAGVVLEAVKAINQGDPRLANWRSIGRSIINPGRGKKNLNNVSC